ncbi:MAG: hypothetical protein NVSMB18_22920 [Acetobacteraceae bacterium]
MLRPRLLRSRLRAGPDADLSHLPVSLDLRAISLAEGARAALAVAALVALNEWADIPALTEAALAAMLTCLCDAGGTIRRRLPMVVGFGLIGAAATAGFALLRGQPLILSALGASAFIFCTSFARVWGPAAMQVGNLLTVVAVLALDRQVDAHGALVLGGMFLAGSLWAAALTLVIWRLHPFRPARQAVAEIYRRLAMLTADLSDLLRRQDGRPDWAAHARAHRRHVRDGLEAARTLVLDTVRGRGAGHAGTNALLIQLEAAEQIFGALIGLSDVLEHGEAGAPEGARPLLPVLRLLFASIADAVLTQRTATGANRAMLDRLLQEAARAADSPALSGITAALLQRVRVAALMTMPEGQSAEGTTPAQADPVRTRFLAPIRANLTWSSAALRHATRSAVVAIPALLITLSSGATYAHWLTITLVLTLQPFFAVTWQRAIERIGGTVLGGVVAAVIATVVNTPLGTAALLFPLSVLAFTVRAVSFGLFMTFLTPLVVLLSELGQPGQSEVTIALWRAAYTILGGAFAVLGAALLWPSWEPNRTRDELVRAIHAHAAFADATLASLLGDRAAPSPETARRQAGVTTNNLEASLSRALQEPRTASGDADATGLQAAMLADAALRRIAGRLAALQHEPGLGGTVDLPAWRGWLAGAFAALAGRVALPGDPPADASGDAPGGALARIARQLQLMDGALRGEATAPRAAPSRPPPP